MADQERIALLQDALVRRSCGPGGEALEVREPLPELEQRGLRPWSGMPWSRDALPGQGPPCKLLYVEPCHLLLGALGDDPSEAAVDRRLGSCHLQAAVVRSGLVGQEKDDLLLLLAGPAGALEQEAWRGAASRVERDDRICRKLVWLPPAGEDLVEESLERFLDRTFLARPWDAVGDAAQPELDPWRMLLDAVDLGARQEDRELFRRWLALLRDARQTPGSDEELVEGLLAALPAGGARP